LTIEYKDSKRIITYPTEYKVHSFTSDGTFQITSGSGNVEYLVVAGGGGGGGAGNTPAGSGGGAGGMLTGTVSKSTGTHTVTVGTGGTGGGTSGDGIFGNNGGNSVFDSITSSGGGGGGAYNGNSNLASSEAQDGGSGGGASWASWSGSEGVGISGQGNDGGNNSDSSSGSLQGGSGGGGAGDVGTAGGGNGGNGGIGLQSSITGTTTYYAGGGYGGIGNGVGSVGTAGDGLIGQGGYGGNYNGNNGGTGADGIVIVRYVDDGSITATGGTITTISEAVTKPTDVQDNSILVEKDTAKRYWFTPQTVDTEEAFSFTTTDTVGALWGNRIYGMKLLSGHSGLNKYIKKAKTYHPTNPTGSRLTTGTLYHVILDSSGTEIARSAGVSASSVSNNSWAETTFSSPVKLLENYTVGMTISTGDANTYLGIGINNNSSSPTNTTRYYKDQSGSASTATTETVLMVFDSDPATGISIPATWTRGNVPTPTYESNFTVNNWLEQDDTYIGVDTSTERLDFAVKRDSTRASTVDMLGETISDTKWILRWDMVTTTLRALTFPAWKFVGTKPTEQAASKVGILTLTSFGTTDADCVAAYAVEE